MYTLLSVTHVCRKQMHACMSADMHAGMRYLPCNREHMLDGPGLPHGPPYHVLFSSPRCSIHGDGCHGCTRTLTVLSVAMCQCH